MYRKIHLFDVDVGGRAYRESDAEEPGDEVGRRRGRRAGRLGLSVCYDIRFPELYRILALEGAELVTVPANFTLYTGQGSLARCCCARGRSRTTYYVAAAAQIGEPWPGRPSYGRSLIADPWGIVVAEAPDEETVDRRGVDRARLRAVREQLPSLANRQADAYRWSIPA